MKRIVLAIVAMVALVALGLSAQGGGGRGPVAAGGPQRFDVGRELGDGRVRRRKKQLGAGREVVHDLEHRRALAAGPRLSREHLDRRRQVAGGLERGE